MISSEERGSSYQDVSQQESLQQKSTLSFVNKKFLFLLLVIWLTIFSITHFTEWQERRQRFTARNEEIKLENREREEIRAQEYERRTRRQQLEYERRQRLSQIDMDIERERRAQLQRRATQRQRYNDYGVW